MRDRRAEWFRGLWTWSALVVVALAVLASGCGSSDSGSDAGAPVESDGSKVASKPTVEKVAGEAGIVPGTEFCGTKPVTVGVADALGNNPWSVVSMAVVRSELAKCQNVEQIVTVGGGDLQKSISDINSLVAQQVDAIVVLPAFGPAELPAIRSAHAAGVTIVPWGAYPGGTAGKDYLSYVDWSFGGAGTRWAEWMVKATNGRGNILFFGGPAGNPVTKGQLDAINAVFAKHPGMKLLTGTHDWAVTNWNPATAQKQAAALLAKHPKIDGIISDFGTDALAATRAFKAAARSLVPIATLDTNGLSCLYERESKRTPSFEVATISSHNWLGRVAVRQALADVQGIGNDEPSQYDLPFYEDSLAGSGVNCDPDLPADFYPSNKLTPDDISRYGKTS